MPRLSSCLLIATGITVVAAAQQPSNTVALVGARLIDGTGAAPMANATLLVERTHRSHRPGGVDQSSCGCDADRRGR